MTTDRHQVHPIDELLARARARLDRVRPDVLETERRAGAIVIDTRPTEQRLAAATLRDIGLYRATDPAGGHQAWAAHRHRAASGAVRPYDPVLQARLRRQRLVRSLLEMSAHVRIIGTDLPGTTGGPAVGPYANIHVGVQRKNEVVDLVPGDAERAVWDFDVDVRNGRFGGPYVHGRGDERFVYLSWGELDDGRFTMFRRAKLQLDSLEPNACDGLMIEGHLGLTDAKGDPLCASVRPPRIAWTVG